MRRYHFDRSRIEFGLCRSALRQIVCNFMGCDNEQLSFVTNEHGKPIPLIDGLTASISVNVSHSGKHGIVGIAPHGKLGIDIEIPVQRKDLEGISKMVFTPKEQSELEKVSGIEKIDLFYKLWTLKEALIKAVGTGFSLNPSRFEIPSDLRKGAMKGAFKFPHLPHINWTLDCLEGKDFIASIAHARVIS